MNGLICALALPSEAPACLALVPEAHGLAPEWLIARRDGAFAGAAALFWRSWSTPGGFPLWLRVPEVHQKQGVGRALVEAARALARGETAGLWSMTPVADGSPAAAFLTACGFDARRREHHFQADIAIMLSVVSAKAEQARARGGAAARAELVDLTERHLEAVSWLISGEMGGGPLANLRGARQRMASPKGEHWRGSQVALVDGEVAGAILWRMEQGVGVVDMAVVAERWRREHLTVIMMERCMALCLAEGVTQGRFHTQDSVENTFGVSRRLQSNATSTEARYYCPLPVG